MLLLDRNIKIYRLHQISGNKTGFTTLTTSIESTIQPLGEEATSMHGGDFGRMFKIYCDIGEDVKEGDQIRDYDGNIYQIIGGGVDKRDDGMIADYLGLTVKKVN